MIGAQDAPAGRSLADFTVELDVYSGPYEWLLALILKDEVEIFEVPLHDLVRLYLAARDPHAPNALERDTDFVGSASALVLLKTRTLHPGPSDGEGEEEGRLSPEELSERLERYLKVRRAADALRDRLAANAGHHPSGHVLRPRPGRVRVDPEKVAVAARRAFSRLTEPPVQHLGPITVTVGELMALIRTSLSRGPVSYETLVKDMDRLRRAVTFAAALSLAHDGQVRLAQQTPLGPLTLEPLR